ncbi:flavodoxin family protein [Pseudonocardia spirodelae]|uniref:NAD(P)H-dependent oxidoreductase n=1 Tax=Pseudonocardia spirodelae TaxID=3133431 RepID=A0ABU8TE13_9PSEU
MSDPARLLIVHHTPSPATAELLAEVRAGATDPEITGVDVVVRAALAATASDLLAADAVLLGTPANFGYMSGALKHFLDQVFYVCGEDTRGLPYGLWVHGGSDTSGATRSVTAVAGALSWTAAAAPVEVTGAPDASARAACRELGAVVAATVMPDG